MAQLRHRSPLFRMLSILPFKGKIILHRRLWVFISSENKKSGFVFATPFPRRRLSDKIKISNHLWKASLLALVNLKRIIVMTLMSLMKKGISLSPVMSIYRRWFTEMTCHETTGVQRSRGSQYYNQNSMREDYILQWRIDANVGENGAVHSEQRWDVRGVPSNERYPSASQTLD